VDIPEKACKSCSSPYIEEEYEFPLCWDCRRWHSRRKIPRVIMLTCGLVLMAVLSAGTYYPETLRATIAYQDGRSAERAQNFGRAIQEYETVLETYPDSLLALAYLGTSNYRSGNTSQAMRILGALWGRDNPKEVANQINNIFDEIKKRAGVK
jgi:tetratricopeptide (TPR) repeat protein